jgi:hypothetical protein
MGFVAYTDAIIFDLLLTSKRTFSGAEELAFDLKNQNPAKFVRETTGRGTHPVSGHTVADYLMVGVPFAKSLDPATKTNWEGTGVELDARVSAEDALATAEKLAMEKFKRSPLPPDSRLWVYRRTRPLGEGLRAFAEISKARGIGRLGKRWWIRIPHLNQSSSVSVRKWAQEHSFPRR